MKQSPAKLAALFSALLLAAAPVWADSVDDGSILSWKEDDPYTRIKDVPTLERLIAKGDAKAQYNLGFLYEHGEGVEKDFSKAVALYQQSAMQNFAPALNRVGRLYYEEDTQGVEHSYTKAKQFFEKAAKQGFAEAQYNLGEMYWHGEGVRKSYAQARKWFSKAAKQGDTDAQSAMHYFDLNDLR